MLNSVSNKGSSNSRPQVDLQIQEAKDILKRIGAENCEKLREAFKTYVVTRHLDAKRGIDIKVGAEKLGVEFANFFSKKC